MIVEKKCLIVKSYLAVTLKPSKACGGTFGVFFASEKTLKQFLKWAEENKINELRTIEEIQRFHKENKLDDYELLYFGDA